MHVFLHKRRTQAVYVKLKSKVSKCISQVKKNLIIILDRLNWSPQARSISFSIETTGKTINCICYSPLKLKIHHLLVNKSKKY